MREMDVSLVVVALNVFKQRGPQACDTLATRHRPYTHLPVFRGARQPIFGHTLQTRDQVLVADKLSHNAIVIAYSLHRQTRLEFSCEPLANMPSSSGDLERD